VVRDLEKESLLVHPRLPFDSHCTLPEKKKGPFAYRSTCDSFMIDIGPGLEVWPCFPLSGETYRLEEFETFAGIHRRFQEVSSSRSLAYEERCKDCEHR